MTTKFTKGPWLVREHDFIGDKLEVWHNDYSGVEQIPIASVEIGLNPLFDAEQRANAHLIAAAPDLYNALETLTTYCEIKGIPTDAAYAALSKARGEDYD